jgi:pimeloyl-ACP methyl ester carboxylesterase
VPEIDNPTGPHAVTPHATWPAAGQRRPRRSARVVTAVVAAALALPLTGTAAQAAGRPAEPAPPVLAWSGCGDGFECTTAAVPLDYNRPDDRTISLSLIRKPAGDPGRRIGSLFTNPGGPGGSGVDFVRNAAAAFDPEVQARFDIVGLDPRGVGTSTPLRCFPSSGEQLAFFTALPPAPVNPPEERAAARAATELGARCAAADPQLARHLSTANVARDLHLLMRAVGDTSLSYYGLSYGTYLGATFANLYPREVRTLVLDGVVEPAEYTGAGPDGRRTPTFVRAGSNTGSSQTLATFFDRCAAAGPVACPFAAGGDPRAKFAEIADRLRTAPITVPDPAAPDGGTGAPVTYGLLVGTTINLLYVDALWPVLARSLQDLYTTADPAVMAAAMETMRTAADPPPAAVPAYSNQPEALRAIVCADTTNPRNPQAWPALGRAADARTPFVGTYWASISQPCATWPARDRARYLGPWNATTVNPALIVGTRFDPATPYRNSEALAAELPGSGLLTLEGVGHTSFGQGRCITTAVGRYLVTGTLPAANTTCTPDRQPFDLAPTAPAERAAAIVPLMPTP